jgi:hypothetical protein
MAPPRFASIQKKFPELTRMDGVGTPRSTLAIDRAKCRDLAGKQGVKIAQKKSFKTIDNAPSTDNTPSAFGS